MFYMPLEVKRDKEGEADSEEPFTVPFLTVYTVFRIDQCEGIQQKYHNEEQHTFVSDEAADEVASGYISREGIAFRTEKGDMAFYRPSEDLIVLPIPEQFTSREEYYSTLFHELTHSTGHPKRLNRIEKTAAFGNNDYNREELVAEIGSASLCATLGIENKDSFTNSAAYIQNWLKALRNDKRMIVWATSRAEKAVRMILNIQDEQKEVLA